LAHHHSGKGKRAVTQIDGLSESEVLLRRQNGLGNDVDLSSGQTFLAILRRNAFTFINLVLFAIGITLIVLGRVGDAVVTAGLVLMNVTVAVVQEGRAKRTLDHIALLSRPHAVVVRDGQQREIDPSEIVLGDVLFVEPGDQIVVDGELVGDGKIDVDESLLTGESDLVPKAKGDLVHSGSFCVGGSTFYEAQKVGADSLASQITQGARAFRLVKTPLQKNIDLVIRILVFLASQLGILLALSFSIHGLPAVESIQMAAVVAALVPQGLFAMIIVAYAMAAVRIARRGVLVQQANAVESLSNVTVLCLDKTGTLTTNRIKLHEFEPIGTSQDHLAATLGDFVASMSFTNRTAEAISEVFGGAPCALSEEVPFSSARKWSALTFDDPAAPDTFVLGAPEVLLSNLISDDGVQSRTDVWAKRGLRVLLFAYQPGGTALHNSDGLPRLPSELVPLCLLSFSDELRPDAASTLAGFQAAGIDLKIISGDNPQTVAAVARLAGLESEFQVVSGLQLAEMDEADLVSAAKQTTVFGRITPRQKESLVRILRDEGYYVAMIGDGVNDVLSLKQAQLGIAMRNGSQATRSVADVVLLDDSFAAMPAMFTEGRRIVNGMQDIVRLFLTRTFYVILLVIGAAIVGVSFPVTPKHNAVLALLTVGIPTLMLAVWARPAKPPPNLFRSVGHFVFPAAFTVAATSLAVYLVYLQWTNDVDLARTALTVTGVLCGLVLIPFVEPPTPMWVGGDELSLDRRPLILALGLLGLFAVILAEPSLRRFFELTALRWLDLGAILIIVAIWAVFLRFVWRRRLFEWWLGLDE
jgi:cation-transporting ATPase E